jgi:hypothetical protein
VDLTKFKLANNTPERNAEVVFLFLEWLLLEKSTVDYIDATRIVKETWNTEVAARSSSKGET